MSAICIHGTCESWATQPYHVVGRTISDRPRCLTYASGTTVAPKTLHLCHEHALADLGVAWGRAA